ncbi:MAG: IclR family transcriptional regulator [Bryobacteraceae bacterium]
MRKAALETPSIQSLDRGLAILEAVAQSPEPVPLGHLTDLLGIDRSSVFRLANTLRRRGFLTNPVGGRDFILGPSIWRLSRKYGWTNMLNAFCREQLRTLTAATGETTHLAVREGRQAFFIDHHSSTNQVIVVSGQTGESVPLYCTAHGKALLADCGVPALKAIFGVAPFDVYTPTTIPTIEDLAAACAVIKAQGFAFDNAEYLTEVRCLASPIRDKDGEIVASIGISAPLNRFPVERCDEFARQVSAAARAVSSRLQAGEPA